MSTCPHPSHLCKPIEVYSFAHIKDLLLRKWGCACLNEATELKKPLLQVMMTGKREQGLRIREITLYL